MVKHRNGTGQNGHHIGRPSSAKQRIDREQFETYCAKQYTTVGIAAAFGVSHDTVERWIEVTYGRPYAEVLAEKREVGCNDAHEVLYRKMKGGVAWAVIWFTKNHMGMSDKVEETIRPGAPAPEPQVWEMPDGRRIVFRP